MAPPITREPSERTRAARVPAQRPPRVAWEAAPGVVLIRHEERVTLVSARACAEVLAMALDRHGSIFVGIDAWHVNGYEPGVRDVFGTWIGENRAVVVGYHMLVRSGMMKMAIQITNLAAGGVITPHSDRDSFERAILAHAPGVDLDPFRTATPVVPTPARDRTHQ